MKQTKTPKTKNAPQNGKNPKAKQTKNPKAEDCFSHIFFYATEADEKC